MPTKSLIIAGAQKCGTSTLFATLANHPGIDVPRDPETGKAFKEIDFFNRHHQRGDDWYFSRFMSDGKTRLDVSPNYLCDPQAHQRMHALLPDAMVVVSLRDPVDRAISQYNHYTQLMPGSHDWDWRCPEDTLDVNVQSELASPYDDWAGILNRGKYLQQLTHLLKFYDRSQVHVMVMDQWCVDPEHHLSALLDFAGLPQVALDVHTCHVRTYDSDPAGAELRKQLVEFYRPHNEALFDFLGARFESWILP
ncbi:sulfotransferase family protein [Rhodopirellula sp. MGV]|uniref:sulfotransferase family protein n=1 Tax=Rhodopirellula sp. MGV TaxID=2023130 RepID=UPI001303F950|nr:sulfotransferase [Rhodopirellula sp. MGV]